MSSRLRPVSWPTATLEVLQLMCRGVSHLSIAPNQVVAQTKSKTCFAKNQHCLWSHTKCLQKRTGKYWQYNQLMIDFGLRFAKVPKWSFQPPNRKGGHSGQKKKCVHVYRWWLVTARIASKLPGFTSLKQIKSAGTNTWQHLLNRTRLPQFLLGLPIRPMTRIAIWWPLIPVGPSGCKAWISVFPACQQTFQVPFYRLYDKLQAHRILSLVHPGHGFRSIHQSCCSRDIPCTCCTEPGS